MEGAVYYTEDGSCKETIHRFNNRGWASKGRVHNFPSSLAYDGWSWAGHTYVLTRAKVEYIVPIQLVVNEVVDQ